MWGSLIKYVSLILLLLGMGFFIIQKNLEYKKVTKEERDLIKKIYGAEEDRRYALYELEKLKTEKKLKVGHQILVLEPFFQEENP